MGGGELRIRLFHNNMETVMILVPSSDKHKISKTSAVLISGIFIRFHFSTFANVIAS